MFIFLLLTNKYTNPYKLIMIFGKKGSGKSTTLTKYAIQHVRKGWTVYSTERIPYWSKYFNSFEAPQLQRIEYEQTVYKRDDVPELSPADEPEPGLANESESE